MAEALTLQNYLAQYVGELLERTAASIEDLNEEDLHFRPDGPCNSIGFDAWHIARTADNLVHFAFAREQPVWLQQGLNEAWGLPKADQGTGMTPEEAYALRFPAAPILAKYARDVAAAVVPTIRGYSDEFLDGRMDIRPNGNLARYEIIGQVIINHGNNHFGMINLALTLAGRPGLGI
ncbi:MAG: DinB family protein [Chloroflexi bacterium]|nr:DinB family protein [Chloroflexota bacterium]MDA1145611.1 DinB family protein [Chloroflexota bacterium]